jgi:hypothetical protein
MPNSVIVQIVWLAILATFVFTVWKGGVAERAAAALVVAAALAAFAIHRLLPPEVHPIALLTGEFLLAAGFLVLAVRFTSLWLGAAMLLQAVQFSLHAWYLVAERPRDILYSVINNIDTVGILICILLGSVAAWRRREAATRPRVEA